MASKRSTGESGNDQPQSPKKGKEELAARARTHLAPTVGAAVLSVPFGPYPDEDKDFDAYYTELSEQCAKVRNGDLRRAESMLLAQAHSLDALFINLSLRSHKNMGQYMDAADRYMRLALRAQSQCRATLETLATIKNPPMVIARQANLTTGPQQVNNGFATSTRTHAHAGNSIGTEQTFGAGP